MLLLLNFQIIQIFSNLNYQHGILRLHFDGFNINWNYWQIKKEYNDESVMNIREEFFNFLEKVIVDGSIYDFSKIWKTGDCIIFNDRNFIRG